MEDNKAFFIQVDLILVFTTFTMVKIVKFIFLIFASLIYLKKNRILFPKVLHQYHEFNLRMSNSKKYFPLVSWPQDNTFFDLTFKNVNW